MVPRSPTIAVVIPVWNEVRLVADAVEAARAIGDEVIVADAGSPDGTAAEAARAGARVVHAAKGRGPQCRAGAAAATADVLLFLHADARLPGSARAAILDALADPQVVGGAFFIRFLPGSWFTRCLEPTNHLRRRITRATYGDTGIFLRASAYRALGGHQPWAVMHDYDLSARMRDHGACRYIQDPPIWASARRFEGRELRTLAAWLAVQSLYRLGVPPASLTPLYPDIRGTPEQDATFMALAREAVRAGERARPAMREGV